MTKILIVDDHPMVREGLEAMLESESGFEVMPTAANVASALASLEKSLPDVILSDIRMPGQDGFSLLKAVREKYPSVKVLLLAGMPLKEEEELAKEMCASGYLPKNVDHDRLTEAIRSIAAGESDFVFEEFQAAPSLLTTREMDVLKLLARGFQRDMIAENLGIGAESVKTHLKGIMNKLGCANASGAVGKAYELGILRA
jgi:DNA-binding NarL/FixJ family response regulator